jgi:hypothetical protein
VTRGDTGRSSSALPFRCARTLLSCPSLSSSAIPLRWQRQAWSAGRRRAGRTGSRPEGRAVAAAAAAGLIRAARDASIAARCCWLCRLPARHSLVSEFSPNGMDLPRQLVWANSHSLTWCVGGGDIRGGGNLRGTSRVKIFFHDDTFNITHPQRGYRRCNPFPPAVHAPHRWCRRNMKAATAAAAAAFPRAERHWPCCPNNSTTTSPERLGPRSRRWPMLRAPPPRTRCSFSRQGLPIVPFQLALPSTLMDNCPRFLTQNSLS